MRHGKISRNAFNAALAAAKARGDPILLQAFPGGPACDFLLQTPYGMVAVSVRRSLRIRAIVDEIAHEYRETLNRIRAADTCPGISCEFWLWSPYGTMRFFRIEGQQLIELSPPGLPLVTPVSITIAKLPGFGAEQPEQDPAGPENPAENPAGAATGQTVPAGRQGAPETGRPPANEPHYLRFLRRRNAEIQREKEAAMSRPPAGSSPAMEGVLPVQENPPGRGDPVGG